MTRTVDPSAHPLNAAGPPLSPLAALLERLLAIAPLLLTADGEGASVLDGGDEADQVGRLFQTIVRAVHADATPARIWALLVAIGAAYPTVDDMLDAQRIFELNDGMDAGVWALDHCLTQASIGGRHARLSVVRNAVLADVDNAARRNGHTGIQQVTRQTVPLWSARHDVTLAAWVEHESAYRSLTEIETDRVLRWHGQPRAAAEDEAEHHVSELLVPWDCVIVVPDIPTPEALKRLTAIALFSPNEVTAIGYDCIPVLSAHLVPLGLADRTAQYLSMVKHIHRVAAISAAATEEFQGFASALPTQGLVGPLVVECQLPVEIPEPQITDLDAVARAAAIPPTRPLVLSVGSLEPRKNHLAVLHAAEALWREGIEFEVMFVGGLSWGDDVPGRIEALREQGRPITVGIKIDETELAAAYEKARFTVFPSLHEGYGLPVAESFAFGTPAITSDFGSTAEIALAGGALLVNPRDDEELISAMRTLLCDDVRLEELRDEIAARGPRTWQDYADELWSFLIEGDVPSGSL